MKKEDGFTLIELMVTLVIAAIVLGLGVPSFSNLIKNNRLTAAANDYIAAVNLARSEAIHRGARVNIEALVPGVAGNEWGGGWKVAIEGGATLRSFDALDTRLTLDAVEGVTKIQYDSQGAARFYNSGGSSVAASTVPGTPPYSFRLCDDRTGETGRLIDFEPTGRPATNSYNCS